MAIRSMIGDVMPSSVYITAPPHSRGTMIKRLRVPKARQKELLAIMDRAWESYAGQQTAPVNENIEPGKKRKRATAA